MRKRIKILKIKFFKKVLIKKIDKEEGDKLEKLFKKFL
jgi:hypothetical protein